MIVLIKVAMLILLGAAYAQSVGNGLPDMDWESFKKFHGKMYLTSSDEVKAKTVFEKNAEAVVVHNQAFADGKVTYSLELNEFADIDPVEFGKRNGLRPGNLTQSSRTINLSSIIEGDSLPASFDWRDRKMVSPVKDQGQCGSCWAFSATGAMESQILIGSGGQRVAILSEEQLVDCDNEDNGCQGGMYTRAWDYLSQNGGIESEGTYPYTAGRGSGGQCKYDSSKVVADVLGYEQLNRADEEYVKQTLIQSGPISIAIDATKLPLYSDGIFSCDGDVHLNHAVLLVGYGSSVSGEGYWMVKNSWGTGWGDQGFFKISRRADLDCGLTKIMAYPHVKARSFLGAVQDGWKFCVNFDKMNTFLGLLIILTLVLVILLRTNRDGRSVRSEFPQEKCMYNPVLLTNEKV